jgi:hypothetical protein
MDLANGESMQSTYGYSRAVAAVYDAPPNSALPYLAVVLLDGVVVTARAMVTREEAASFAADALRVLQALDLASPEITLELN